MSYYTIVEVGTEYMYSMATDAAARLDLNVQSETFSERLTFQSAAGTEYVVATELSLDSMNSFDEMHSVFCNTPVFVADFAGFEVELQTLISSKLSCELAA